MVLARRKEALLTLCVSAAGEVKARCGTSFYKNVMYPFVKMYDPEDSHNLSIWVRGASACVSPGRYCSQQSRRPESPFLAQPRGLARATTPISMAELRAQPQLDRLTPFPSVSPRP